ncbi:hypothetical protein [Shewanella kaireitica]|uniref:hypothetical protein n=1 Tax=Shewanella kaireitica TaxID=212021 RepID=UPI00200C5814|nr:hypothetical protein [Shewanella kaireitica]MCL1094218.1 hypothetical protein [Shewanella kaireitica]
MAFKDNKISKWLEGNKFSQWLKDDKYHRRVAYMDEVLERVEKSESVDELTELVDEYQEKKGDLFYSFLCSRSVNVLHSLIVLVFASYIGWMYLTLLNSRYTYGSSSSNGFIVTVATLALMYLLVKLVANLKKTKKDKFVNYIKRQTKAVYNKVLLLRHGAQVKSLSSSAFYDFQRGNYSNHVAAYRIELGDEFEGVNAFAIVRSEHTEQIKRTEGFGKNKRVYYEYKTFWRYGVVMSGCNRHKGVKISNSGSVVKSAGYETFKPSLISFDKKFYSEGETQIAVAQFLTPKMMLNIEALSQQYSNLTIEADKDGHLLVSQVDVDILPPLEGYITFDNFTEELLEKTSLEIFMQYTRNVHSKIYN